MYYAPMLRCWQLVSILVSTNHPFLRGAHSKATEGAAMHGVHWACARQARPLLGEREAVPVWVGQAQGGARLKTMPVRRGLSACSWFGRGERGTAVGDQRHGAAGHAAGGSVRARARGQCGLKSRAQTTTGEGDQWASVTTRVVRMTS
jgi:hypothetical protein